MAIKKGKSLCFFSTKGGVGKTTNLLNLAGIFEQMQKKVLIIDLDLYSGGVATLLNKNYEKSVFNLVYDLSNNTYEDIKKYTVAYDNYIDLLCAPRDPRDAGKIETKYLEDVINKATLSYDIVLIDTNHALNDISLSILDIVDETVFVLTNDLVNLKNMKSLLSIFNTLNINNYKILLNNSRDPFKTYFTEYDIKHILKKNVDYTLTKNLFLKDMPKYNINGTIISLDRKFSDIMPDDYDTFVKIATDLLEGANHE